tara:strand:- start:186 stop:446 length:261 start_codon:yes stop_codon:yes gene_type:complete
MEKYRDWLDKLIKKLLDFMGISNQYEGWRRITLVSFLIPIIFWIYTIDFDFDNYPDIVIIVFFLSIISWILVIKIAAWIIEGFKKK